MEEAGRLWCPDYPVKVESAICRHWRKAADPVFDPSGRLIPYEDRELDSDTLAEIVEFNGNDYQASWEFGLEVERVAELRKAA